MSTELREVFLMIPKSADEITDEERRKFFGLKDGEDDNDPFYRLAPKSP